MALSRFREALISLGADAGGAGGRSGLPVQAGGRGDVH
jgi:hypothetical protein